MLKAQEDVAGGQKREVEEEDPYNEDNVDQVSFQQKQDQFLLMSRLLWSGHNEQPLLQLLVLVQTQEPRCR